MFTQFECSEHLYARVRRARSIVATLACCLALSAVCWAAHVERDDTGRSVTVPDHIHRIVCLAPSLTDIVYALGAQNDLVGITDFTDYPPQAAHEKPSVGAIVNPSLEKIVALHPDVVLALPVWNGAETIKGLERLGLPVVLFNTEKVSDIYRNIATVGEVIGREQQASALVANLRARADAVRRESAGKKRLSLLVVVASDPLITAGRDAFITEMITAAGGRSVTEDVPQDWLQMNVEAVLPRNPDYLLLIEGGPVSLKTMQQQPGMRSLEAVQKGRVITVDGRIQIPGPVAFDGLEDLAKQIRSVESH